MQPGQPNHVIRAAQSQPLCPVPAKAAYDPPINFDSLMTKTVSKLRAKTATMTYFNVSMFEFMVGRALETARDVPISTDA